MTQLVPVSAGHNLPVPGGFPVELQEQIADRTEQLRAKSKAKNTREAYASDWRQFDAWCRFAGVPALPATPATVTAYLASMTVAKTPRGGSYSTATIARRLCSIAHFHKTAGKADPTENEDVKTVMAGITRDQALRSTNQKSAIRVKHLRKGLKGEAKKPADVRNRALLLIGFAGAFRRSELVGIDVEHLTFNDDGAVGIRLPTSKTNQTGELEMVWILPAGALCPVRALRAWIALGRIESGPVFRGVDRHGNVKGRLSTDAAAYIVKCLAKKAGLDPRQFSAHSLRAGLVTEGFALEQPIELIQQQTRHRDVNTLLRYRREVEPQKRNVSAHLGL